MVALPNVNKKTDSWPQPDQRTLGLIIDPDKGNELLRLEGQVVILELKPGDIIVNVDSMRRGFREANRLNYFFRITNVPIIINYMANTNSISASRTKSKEILAISAMGEAAFYDAIAEQIIE